MKILIVQLYAEAAGDNIRVDTVSILNRTYLIEFLEQTIISLKKEMG